MNRIDHWLSMRGLTGIHTRDSTLAGNLLHTLSTFISDLFAVLQFGVCSCIQIQLSYVLTILTNSGEWLI